MDNSEILFFVIKRLSYAGFVVVMVWLDEIKGIY